MAIFLNSGTLNLISEPQGRSAMTSDRAMTVQCGMGTSGHGHGVPRETGAGSPSGTVYPLGVVDHVWEGCSDPANGLIRAPGP